jgi:hypothetical protein
MQEDSTMPQPPSPTPATPPESALFSDLPAPIARAYRMVRQHLHDRLAAHPSEAQPLVQRALDALDALDHPATCPITVADQPDPRTAQFRAEAADEIAREKLDP